MLSAAENEVPDTTAAARVAREPARIKSRRSERDGVACCFLGGVMDQDQNSREIRMFSVFPTLPLVACVGL